MWICRTYKCLHIGRWTDSKWVILEHIRSCDRKIASSFLFSSSPQTNSTISSAHGFTKVSPTVWGFFVGQSGKQIYRMLQTQNFVKCQIEAWEVSQLFRIELSSQENLACSDAFSRWTHVRCAFSSASVTLLFASNFPHKKALWLLCPVTFINATEPI
jgi:hypothetical protein